MTKTINFILLVTAFCLIFTACGKKHHVRHIDLENPVAENKQTDTSNLTNNLYGIKSGIISMEAEIQNQKQVVMQYFDDYGAKELTESYFMFNGKQVFNGSQIVRDGYIYIIDLKTKTCKKMKEPPLYLMKINFNDINSGQQGRLNIKKTGVERFLDKDCDNYSMDFTEMNIKGTYTVWKGIPLKTKLEIKGIVSKVEAKKIEEDANIPAGKFDVPAGYKVVEAAPNDKK